MLNEDQTFDLKIEKVIKHISKIEDALFKAKQKLQNLKQEKYDLECKKKGMKYLCTCYTPFCRGEAVGCSGWWPDM